MLKARGRQGEVAADLHTDFPQRFAQRRRVFALLPGGARRELQLDAHWEHKGRVVLKFHGVDTISSAEELAGAEIQIPREERAELDSGAVYVSDLVGCTVTTVEGGGEREIGKIAEVQFGAGEAPLLVVGRGKDEHLVPFALEFLKSVDLVHKRVRLKLPEGMLELDAPLNDEEKHRQQGSQASGTDRGRGRSRHRQ